jgi:hypothetical protein
MKVGDLVRLMGNEHPDYQTWTIAALRSDARGIWIQFDEMPRDTWHWSIHYEVINESR